MINIIDKIFTNLKEAYKESIIIDNEKLQDLLFTALADTNKLKEIATSIETKTNIETEINKGKKMSKTRYTYDQVKAITKIQLALAREEIPLVTAEREILKIANTFPVHNLPQYNKRVKNSLMGIGTYGFAFPSNWAKALLEATNNDKLVLQAFRQQQDLYLKKDGRINKNLEKILNSIED